MVTIDEEKTEETKRSQAVPKTIAEQPGGLRSETRMTIQTRQAQKIVVGRRKGKDIQPIIGLFSILKVKTFAFQANRFISNVIIKEWIIVMAVTQFTTSNITLFG